MTTILRQQQQLLEAIAAINQAAPHERIPTIETAVRMLLVDRVEQLQATVPEPEPKDRLSIVRDMLMARIAKNDADLREPDAEAFGHGDFIRDESAFIKQVLAVLSKDAPEHEDDALHQSAAALLADQKVVAKLLDTSIKSPTLDAAIGRLGERVKQAQVVLGAGPDAWCKDRGWTLQPKAPTEQHFVFRSKEGRRVGIMALHEPAAWLALQNRILSLEV